jgi:hypothetical protein
LDTAAKETRYGAAISLTDFSRAETSRKMERLVESDSARKIKSNRAAGDWAYLTIWFNLTALPLQDQAFAQLEEGTLQGLRCAWPISATPSTEW